MKTKTKPKKRGRQGEGGGQPSPFGGIDQEQIKKLAKVGWTDAQMSDFFGVTESTWTNWKKKHTRFFVSLKAWKDEFDSKIERKLAQRAMGYEYKEITYDKSNKKVKAVTKEVIPDVTAQIFWLKNRKPKEWRDKHQVEVEGGDTYIQNIISSFNGEGKSGLTESDKGRIGEVRSILAENMRS